MTGSRNLPVMRSRQWRNVMSPKSIARASVRGNDRDHSGTTRKLRTITGRVYVASSLSTYSTPRYARELERIRAFFPHADILPARDLFRSNDDWRRRWPELLTTLQAVVFFADDDGYIGYGVWTELTDALDQNIPVRYLTPEGRLYEISADDGDLETTAFRPWDWRQFATVAYKVPASEILESLPASAKDGA